MVKQSTKEKVEAYFLISPWLIGFTVFVSFPLFYSFFVGFTEYNIFTPPKWIGFQNYIKMFRSDPLFWHALKITLIYSGVSIPSGLAYALLIAIILNRKIRGLSLVRTMYFLPVVLPGVAISLLWVGIFNKDFGLINVFLSKLYIGGPSWLHSEEWVLPAFIVMSWWFIGRPTIIFLAGLQAIPTGLYEVAEIDGAGRWQKLLNITLPMLSPVILFNLIMSVIGAFQIFASVYVMTGGGPSNASLFYVMYLYQQGFKYMHIGYASALAWFLFALILLFSTIAFKSSPWWVYYETEKGGGN